MVVGFLFSRTQLSIFTFLFGVNGLRGIHPKRWIANKWWLLGVAWIALYALTWFWSEDKSNWGTRLEVKLPFLILPLAFSFLPRFSVKQIQVITTGMGLLFMCSAVYSVSFLLHDSAYYITGYKYSHVLPTLPKYDHIRASMAAVLFIAWSVYVWPSLGNKGLQWLNAFFVVSLVAYIHILAAKTGILSLYIFLLGYGFYLSFARKKLLGLVMVVAIPVLVVVASRNLPTFRERVNYMYYSYFMLIHKDKSGNIGDIARLMSYKIAFGLIAEHPVTGVGTGDMKQEMDKKYAELYPDVPEYGRLLPHNQLLTVGLGCGIPAMLLFGVWVFMPLAALKRNRQSFFFLIVWIILFMQLMIEPVLEVQFGVFVFLFFLLMQRHELTSGETAERTL